MKLSVSLPDDDVALLDSVIAETDAPGRSAVLHEAINLLREARLAREYRQAADEWNEAGDAAAWATTDMDGLSREAW